MEITDEYQYLGLKLRPSGSFNLAVQELNDKASRARLGISNFREFLREFTPEQKIGFQNSMGWRREPRQASWRSRMSVYVGSLA